MKMVCINNGGDINLNNTVHRYLTLNKIYECEGVGDDIYYSLTDDEGNKDQHYLISRFISIQSYRDKVLTDLGI